MRNFKQMQINVKKNSNVSVLQIICTSHLQAYVCGIHGYIYIHTHNTYTYLAIYQIYVCCLGHSGCFWVCPVSRRHQAMSGHREQSTVSLFGSYKLTLPTKILTQLWKLFAKVKNNYSTTGNNQNVNILTKGFNAAKCYIPF